MNQSYQFNKLRLLSLMVLLIFSLSGCGGNATGDNGSPAPAPLNGANLNLIFVVSPDLAYSGPGDINPTTANLTNQGLQRSLLMATYLKQQVLGSRNVTAIYALEPMTHLQTANHYPDMAAIGYIQQFALLNQITIGGTTANSYPLYTSYAPGSVPSEVVPPNPYNAGSQGLDFSDVHGNNVQLVTRIIKANTPGFHVFSAPWETISALLTDIKKIKGVNLDFPTTYMGPNIVYAISITPSGEARLFTLDSKLTPPATYPVLPSPVASASGSEQIYFSYTRTGGVNGVVIPPGINTNQTVYLIRHAEAHPTGNFEDGNYVGAGQWRALALPNALRDKISPTRVYSIDPGQSFAQGSFSASYVRPSLTVLPYVVANNLPYYLVAGFSIISDPNDPVIAKLTSDFFFTGGNLSNQTLLVAWEHEHFPPLITALLQSYGGTVPVPPLSWPQSDYDTIWTVKLDARGNLTVNNGLSEGIDSAALPAKAPQF